MLVFLSLLSLLKIRSGMNLSIFLSVSFIEFLLLFGLLPPLFFSYVLVLEANCYFFSDFFLRGFKCYEKRKIMKSLSHAIVVPKGAVFFCLTLPSAVMQIIDPTHQLVRMMQSQLFRIACIESHNSPS